MRGYHHVRTHVAGSSTSRGHPHSRLCPYGTPNMVGFLNIPKKDSLLAGHLDSPLSIWKLAMVIGVINYHTGFITMVSMQEPISACLVMTWDSARGCWWTAPWSGSKLLSRQAAAHIEGLMTQLRNTARRITPWYNMKTLGEPSTKWLTGKKPQETTMYDGESATETWKLSCNQIVWDLLLKQSYCCFFDQINIYTCKYSCKCTYMWYAYVNIHIYLYVCVYLNKGIQWSIYIYICALIYLYENMYVIILWI